MTYIELAAKKVERQRPGDVEAKRHEDPQLHLPEFLGGVGVVRDVDAVFYP